ASAISDFSHHIDLSVEKAWMLASVRYGDNKIRSGWLLLALLTIARIQEMHMLTVNCLCDLIDNTLFPHQDD
ncbi:hypothetical protein MJN47_29725, partial [Salmonella enterica subsp. enterica serovar Lubbock]|nr:hypothetical protein [Salmonella enterica subsp. enterica serovar Lubbock]